MSVETDLRDGDADARRVLFELCQTRVRSYVRKRVRDAADVDDLVSEVVIRALDAGRAGRGPDELSKWVFGIARNVLREHHKERRKAAERTVATEVGDVVREPVEPPLDLRDLPELPVELEYLMGKRHLARTVDAAVSGIPVTLQPLMRAHIDETRRCGEYAVGTRLAAVTGLPVKNVDRQLGRARDALRAAFDALVLARGYRDTCEGLAAIVPEGRDVVLDPVQSKAVLAHAAGCATCGPRLGELRGFGRWAVGPGLLVLAGDDDERRRALAGLAGRDAPSRTAEPPNPAELLPTVELPSPVEPSPVEPPNAAEPPQTSAPPNPAELPHTAEPSKPAEPPQTSAPSKPVESAQTVESARAVESAGPVDRVRGLVVGRGGSSRAVRASSPVDRVRAVVVEQVAKLDWPLRFAQEYPEVARRVGAGAVALVSGLVLLASVLFAPDGEHDRVEGLPGPVPTTTVAPPSATGSATTPSPSGTGDVPRGGLRRAGAPDGEPLRTAATTHPNHTPTTTTGPEDPRNTVEPPRPWNGEITVDGTGSGYTAFSVAAAPGWHPTAQPFTVAVRPGDHVLTSSGQTTIPFHVTENGQIRYSSAYDGMLAGRDTSTLRVRGLPITLDASELSYQSATVSGTGVSQTRTKTVNLWPGPHFVQTPAGDRLDFEVTPAGVVRYGPQVDPVLDGAGTSTLTVRGLAIVLDGNDVDYANLTIGGTGWPAPQEVRTVRLLPGNHSVVTPAGTSHPFRVTPAGTLAYDPALEGVLTGAGGTVLAVHGVVIRVDATRTGTDHVAVDGAGWWPATAPHDFRLLPGGHRVRLHDQRSWPFTVDRAGAVGYDPGLDPLLDGRGTGTLAFR
ncbi:hypothetical protein LZG04_30445 [Saccharothrix sp. S26]|uniref:RNA polymerase sigma factor n=1 Tax=Saccharothrix sp. S26 TaxID=2907215 RepID=UPI001F24D5DC|nr:RNA polymerase sigma factor [Saccharothrix sp. S26]MCE6999092.1 hypothetical protein [Saccharothrix sp. S26]